MNTVFSIILFLYVFCSSATWAFLDHRFLPFKNVQSPPGTEEAGDPLFLTPLLDAGKLIEAKHRSRVDPEIGGVKSHAGYLTVNRTTKSHLYFWFIPKTNTNNVANSSLILWLQGGPGCSSLFGMFSENGPFKVTAKGLRRRVHAWTNDYNMLYIDQPVGTGFSFTEDENTGYISTQEEVGEHLYEALVQFYELFPEMKELDFYIAGESYGGKYVPSLAYKVHTANQQASALKVPLKGLMIGNGFSDPENQLGYAEYLYGVGLIDKNERIQLESTQEKVTYAIRSGNWSTAMRYKSLLFDEMHEAIDFSSFYDYTRDHFGGDHSYVEYLVQDEVRKSIHAGGARYEICSDRVFENFEEDFLQTVRPRIETLLEHYPILFYNGQFDIICAHPLTENVFRNLHWSGASAYGQAKRRTWRVGDTVAGYYKSAGNLIDVLVRDASHMAPSDQPKNMLNLVNMFIEKRLRDNSTLDRNY